MSDEVAREMTLEEVARQCGTYHRAWKDYTALTAERDSLRREVAELRERVMQLDAANLNFVQCERRELVGQLEQFRERCTAMRNQRTEDAERIVALTAQLTAATRGTEDSELLDWLDSVNTATNARNGTIYGWRFDINHNRAALTDHNLPALSVREAIDAAIRAAKGER